MIQEKGLVIGSDLNIFYQPKKLIQRKRYRAWGMKTLGN
jgi:hypothetical protein